ncbi:MAG: glycosyltransferase [Chitinophagales bacterium]
MKLSIVIVNYNVRYFLEQAIQSVYKSGTNFDFEIFVVDNHSSDDSLKMLAEKFPAVNVIANKKNVGFSKANNQAVSISKGEYVLLLNPDTIIREDTLQQCIDFMDAHTDAGGLGVKMLDGTGHFLPESKRGFPSPMAAFAKMSGMARLFPQSRLFGQYHLTYLDPNQTHEVDVLSGAFMLLRRSVLDKTGLLDEAYFMYGEDIDLSYRIKKAGYKNYYFADTSILHFKGESTKKGSLNYVRVFYNAMLIFSSKHVSGTKGKLLTILLNIAIYIRAFFAVIQQLLEKIGAPVLDTVLITANLYVLQLIWENYIRAQDRVTFPLTYFYVNIPIYVSAWLFAMWLNGVYDKNAKWLRLLTGLSLGTLIISMLYAFFPEFLRTSRGIIVIGYITNFMLLFLVRLTYRIINGTTSGYFSDIKNMIIVGTEQDADDVWDFIQHTGLDRKYIGFLSAAKEDSQSDKFLGEPEKMEELVSIFDVKEIIFCSNAVSAQTIIDAMGKMGGKVEYKIASGQSIIGSNSRDTAGDLYTFDIGYNLNKPLYKRMKRLFDIFAATAGILTYPIFMFFIKRGISFFRNCFAVLFNKKTWIGYDRKIIPERSHKLPPIPDAVFAVSDGISSQDVSIKEKLHIIYAKEYTPVKDMRILLRNLF